MKFITKEKKSRKLSFVCLFGLPADKNESTFFETVLLL